MRLPGTLFFPVAVLILLGACADHRFEAISATGIPEPLELFNPTEENIRVLREADPSLPFVTAVSLSERRLYEAALTIFRDDARNGDSFWAVESAAEAVSYATRSQRWYELEEMARLGIARKGDDGRLLEGLARSLYRQERFADLYGLLDREMEGSPPFLWRAVSAYELGMENWRERFLQAFLSMPLGDEDRRLYLFLYYQDLLKEFQREERILMEVAYRASLGEWGEAGRLLLQLNGEDVSVLIGRYGIPAVAGHDLSLVFLRSGRSADGVAWMDEHVSPDAEMLAAAGKYEEAVVLLSADDDMEGVIGVLLESGTALEEILERLGSVSEQIPSPDAVLGPALSDLVRSREWDRLERIMELLPEQWVELRARTGVIIAVATGQPTEEYLAPARRLSEGSYYRVVAEYLAEGSITLVETEPGSKPPVGDVSTVSPGGELARAGVIAPAFDLLWDTLWNDPSTAEAIVSTAIALFDAGGYYEAVTLLRRALTVLGRGPRESEISILYPFIYPVEVEYAARSTGGEMLLLYGIMREESHFRTDALSAADARGLVQVIPSTAVEMARRADISVYDLENAGDNLRLGAEFLAFLRERFAAPTHRIGAYNAGQGRMTEWESEFGDLPPLLFIEAIPYVETRSYIRKVVVSTLYYAYRSGVSPELYLTHLLESDKT